jgi:hypothetical protein
MWPTHYLPNTNRGGEPRPRFYLTTPTYPVEVIEEMASAASFVALTPGVGADDEMLGSAAFVSGEMTAFSILAYDFYDELESAAMFVSGSLVTFGFVVGSANDELESAASFVSGVLADPLIVYDNWPLGADTEDLQSAASFVSGVLA